jgi:hypothetical protein
MRTGGALLLELLGVVVACAGRTLCDNVAPCVDFSGDAGGPTIDAKSDAPADANDAKE